MTHQKHIGSLLILASALVAGCNNNPTAEDTGATNSTSMTTSNAWQSTKEGSTNAWDATKTAASNAWDATKETSSNLWDKTKRTFESGYTNNFTNGVSTNYFGYDYSGKDAFVAEAKASLDDLDHRISNLTNQSGNATGGQNADLQQKLQDINHRRSDLQAKYDAIKNASSDNWNDAKAAYVKSYYDLRASIKSAEDYAKTNM